MQAESRMEIQAVLRNELLRRTKSNPKYSLRTFAQHLGVSAATLSGVMAGKRTLSTKKANVIADKMNFDPIQQSSFVNAVAASRKPVGFSNRAENSPATKQLSLDEFYAISDWYHYAIREMPSLKRKHLDARTIAKELGCSYIEAQDALERLKRLGLIVEKDGKFMKTERHVTSGTDFPSSAMKRFHIQLLQKAKQSLLTDSLSERDFTNITMAVDSTRIAEAKQKIKKFRWELCEFLEGGKPDRIYSLTVGLFPLSRRGKK